MGASRAGGTKARGLLRVAVALGVLAAALLVASWLTLSPTPGGRDPTTYRLRVAVLGLPVYVAEPLTIEEGLARVRFWHVGQFVAMATAVVGAWAAWRLRRGTA